MQDRDIGTSAELKEIDVPVQKVILNGEEHTIMGKTLALVCPKCDKPLTTFPADVDRLTILKSLHAADEQQLNSQVYCQKCGQKLRFMRPAPIDASDEVIKNG